VSAEPDRPANARQSASPEGPFASGNALEHRRKGAWLWSRSTLLGLGVFVAFFLLSLTKIGSFTQDESEYHFPTLLNFYQNGWAAMLNDRYAAANTPLPYLLIALLAKVMGPSLLLARLVTALVSFASFLLAKALLERRRASPFAVAALLFFPYFFVNSFVFYAVNFGVLFLLAGLLVLQKARPGGAGFFLAGTFFSAAVMCQQFYLVVPVAVAMHRMLEQLRSPALRRAGWIADEFIASVLLLAPLLAPFALFAAWGGITHVNFRVHSVMFSPTNITGILFVVGFYFFPYVLQVRREIPWAQWLVVLAASIAMVVLFRPTYSDVQGPGLFTGLVLHLVDIVQKRQPIAAWLLLTLLVMAGMLAVWALGRSLRDSWERLLFVIAAVLTIPYWMNSQMGERHLLGLMVVLLLLVLPRFDELPARIYSGSIGLLGVSYFFYWIFIKFS
jgi:hypothetical protein